MARSFLKRCVLVVLGFCLNTSCSQNTSVISYSTLGKGWSNNSVNTVKFRKNSVVTHKEYQFSAYYDAEGYLIVGKRKATDTHWETLKTQYKANVDDAHNAISLAVDGNGYLHISWDHHNTKLRYAKSKEPLGLVLGDELQMTGNQEGKVTYPEFYNLPNGNLVFFYRSGESGRGNLVINSYDTAHKNWRQLQYNLIDGENERSAYWQACVDVNGVIHVSWVWRETWDVETNHDLCYAKSLDGGLSWLKSTGDNYSLPITIKDAEVAWRIPQNSNLMNQTAMTTSSDGTPYIVSYWNANTIPQYQIVYLSQERWKTVNTAFRTTPFVLGGGGTKSIPISRPDILIDDTGIEPSIYILFRDLERGNKISLGYAPLNRMSNWKVVDISDDSVGQWEPNYDIALWHTSKKLHVFYQNVTQIDGEGVADVKATDVQILEVNNIQELIK